MFDKYKVKIEFEAGIKPLDTVKDFIFEDNSGVKDIIVGDNLADSNVVSQDVVYSDVLVLNSFIKNIDIDFYANTDKTINLRTVLIGLTGKPLEKFTVALRFSKDSVIDKCINSLPNMAKGDYSEFSEGLLTFKSDVTKVSVKRELVRQALSMALCGVVLPLSLIHRLFTCLEKYDNLQIITSLPEYEKDYKELIKLLDGYGFTFKDFIELNNRNFFNYTMFLEDGVLLFPCYSKKCFNVVFIDKGYKVVKLTEEQLRVMYMGKYLADVKFLDYNDLKEVPCLTNERIALQGELFTPIHKLFTNNEVTDKNVYDLTEI